MNIKISRTNKRLSSVAGLKTVSDLLISSRIEGLVYSSLPEIGLNSMTTGNVILELPGFVPIDLREVFATSS